MSEDTKTTKPVPANTRSAAEVWVERIATYWGRALADAWRTVFPPRKDNQ